MLIPLLPIALASQPVLSHFRWSSCRYIEYPHILIKFDSKLDDLNIFIFLSGMKVHKSFFVDSLSMKQTKKEPFWKSFKFCFIKSKTSRFFQRTFLKQKMIVLLHIN